MKLFSDLDKQLISEIFENQKYTSSVRVNDRIIFDIPGDNIIAASLRVPFFIPDIENPKVPFVEMTISFMIRLKEFNQNNRTFLNYFASRFPELISEEFALNHEIEKQDLDKLKAIVKQYLPAEYDPTMYYRPYLSKIREKLFENKKDFFKIDGIWSEEIEELAPKIGFKPIEGLPLELKNGIPKDKEIRALFYSSNDHENMIIEHGFFSYWGDFTFKNIWIRVGLESYSVYLLYKLYEDNLQMSPILSNWIYYARNIIHRIEEIYGNYIFEKDLLPVNRQEFLMKEIPMIALFKPQLAIEANSENKEKLVQRDLSIFNAAPTSFDELISLNLFRQADIMLSNKAIPDALKTYAKALMILTKKNHSKGTVTILRKLAAVAKRSGNLEQAAKYLNNALDQAKKGGVDLDVIFRIQLELGNIYQAMKNHEAAHQQYYIVYSFMKTEKNPELSKYEALSLIYMAKNYTVLQNYSEAYKLFSKAKPIAEKNHEIFLDYVLEKAKYYETRKKSEREISVLLQGVKMKGKVDSDKLSEILIRLGYLYLYTRNRPEKTVQYLSAAEQLLTKKNAPTIRKKIQMYEILSDACKQLKEFQKFRMYAEQAKILRKSLEEMQ